MYRALLYLQLQPEQIRVFVESRGDRAQPLEKPSRRYHIELPSSFETTTVDLWETGKAICSSSVSYAKALEAGRWLRQSLKPQEGKAAEIIAYGEIRDGRAELQVTDPDTYRRVCEIEIREVFLTAQSLKLTEAVTEKISAALADWQAAELVRLTHYDGEMVGLKSITVDIDRKDALLLSLGPMLKKAEQEEKNKSVKALEVTRLVLATAASAIGSIALNILASAIWEHIVRAWACTFLHLHLDGDKPMLSAPLKELSPRFPEIDYLAEHGQSTAADIARALNLSLWRVQADMNWLVRRKLAEESAIDAYIYFRLIVAEEYPKFGVTTPVHGEDLEVRVNHFGSVLDV